MNKMKKTSFRVYAAWNYDKEERDLDEFSKEGWQLLKGGCFHSTFEKDLTQSFRNRIDFNPSILKSNEEKEKYIGFFEDQGWEFVNATYNGWSYFRKPIEENVPEREYAIYTDTHSFGEMLKRWKKLGIATIILESFLMLIYTYLFIIEQDIVFLFGTLIFLGITLWITSGMKKMNQKLTDIS